MSTRETKRRISANSDRRYWRQIMGAAIHRAKVRSECIVHGRKITLRQMPFRDFVRTFLAGRVLLERQVSQTIEHWREIVGMVPVDRNDMVDAAVYAFQATA